MRPEASAKNVPTGPVAVVTTAAAIGAVAAAAGALLGAAAAVDDDLLLQAVTAKIDIASAAVAVSAFERC